MIKPMVLLMLGVLVGGAARPDVVREQREVRVGAHTETWRLVWQGEPRPMCSVRDADVAMTCPCSGWAYGEAGKLALVRTRDGRELERMDLGRVFEDQEGPPGQRRGEATLQRWPTRSTDITTEGRVSPRVVRQRRTVRSLSPADYDRDGQASQFLIQVGALPCGKHQMAAVGVSKSNPHLHALTSTDHPERPLVMPPLAWAALLRSEHPAPVLVWACGDHGSEERSLLEVSAHGGRITAIQRDYSCAASGAPGALVRTTPQ